MLWPLCETLALVAPHLPPALVSPATIAQVKQLANYLPDAFSACYLECRLGANAPQVDFSVGAAASVGGRALLVEPGCTYLPADLLTKSQRWRQVHEWLAQWANPNSTLYQEIPLVWLEFDHADQAFNELPVPSVIFCLDPQYVKASKHPHGAIVHRNTRDLQPFMGDALALLFGYPVAKTTDQTLARCFALLPPSGKLFYMSVMLARDPAPLKVSGAMPRDQLVGYLERLGWPGSARPLNEAMTLFDATSDLVRFDMTIDEGIAPRLGLEFFSATQREAPDARRAFLDQLVAHGLCTVEKCGALQTWAGTTRVIYPQQSWLTRLRRSWYVKMVYEPGQTLAMKAYLGFMPSLVSLASLRSDS